MTAVLPANPSVLPGAGDLVVAGPADVLAVAPGFIQQAQGAPAPVRDALVAGLDGVHERYQELAGYAAAQCDILRATDQYLVGLAEDRGYFPQPGEAQEAFRTRVIAVPSQVTPAGLIAVVNAILKPFTSVQAEYLESILDRAFFTDGTASFHTFCNGLASGTAGDVSPTYADRFYRDDALAGGANAKAVANRDPGGAWVFGDELGRFFVIRVPVVADTALSLIYAGFNASNQPILLGPNDVLAPELGGAEVGGLQTNGPPIVEPTPTGGNLATTAGGRGLFLGDGSNTSGAEADGSVAVFLFTGAQSALATYQAMVNAVERIRGQSIRWSLIPDPNLLA